MKYAIRIEDTRSKTIIVDADSLDQAINKVECDAFTIDLDDEPIERKVFPSPFSMEGGIATPEQIQDCELFSVRSHLHERNTL